LKKREILGKKTMLTESEVTGGREGGGCGLTGRGTKQSSALERYYTRGRGGPGIEATSSHCKDNRKKGIMKEEEEEELFRGDSLNCKNFTEKRSSPWKGGGFVGPSK